jgi:YVTN family beta-propeller protein
MNKFSTPHRLLRLAASGPVWLCAASFALAQTTGFVFTANEAANSVSRIELSTGKVDTVPLPLSPHNVDISGPGRPLLVVGPGVQAAHGEEGHGAGMEGHGEEGLLAVLDPIDLSQPPRVLIPVGEHPAHVLALRDGSVAFVTNAGEDTVGVVDLAAGKMIARIPTGKYPHGMRLSPDEQFLLVANVEDGSVSLIETATRVETARIPVGKAPVQVGFLPDGLRAFVSLRDEDAVAVINLSLREVTAHIPVGRGPIQLHATPDGRFVFIANQGSDSAPDNRVSVVEVATSSVIATIETGTAAHGVDVSADGKQAFVTNIGDATVAVIDIASLKVIATYEVGDGPNGIAYLEH